MNIFYIDEDPYRAAQMQCDKHVVKMILESAQMLSTAHHIYGLAASVLYRKTHVNHPSNIWTRESVANYRWLYQHFDGLCKEYTHRYGKIHLTETKLSGILSHIPDKIDEVERTPFRLAMPDEFKSDDPIESYRKYYKSKQEAMSMVWTKRNKPEWFNEN